MATEQDLKAQELVAFVRSLEDFAEIRAAYDTYGHMGATLADAVLQAGVNFERTVKPRVDAILQQYPEARTTTAFSALVREKGAAEILNWQDGPKPQRLLDLLHLLRDEGIETETALLSWLNQEGNSAHLQEIKGIKIKTHDYLRILCGDPEAVAVDVNLRTFFRLAGVGVSGDEDLAATVKRAAHLMGVTPAGLDHAIWSWVASTRANRSRETPASP